MPLVTLSEYKAATGAIDDSQDAKIEASIAQAVAAMEAITGRSFGEQDRTEQHDGGGAILLRSLPVMSEPVITDTQSGVAANAVGNIKSGVFWYGQHGRAFPCGVARFTVVYQSGALELPAELRAAVIETATAAQARTPGVAMEKDGDWQASYANAGAGGAGNSSAGFDIPGHAAAIFARYKLIV